MKYQKINGIKFSENTSPQVIKAIQTCMDLEIRVKIDFGDPRTGEAFNHTADTFGYIKAKAGDGIYPILVNDRKSMNGEPLRDDSIVKIEGSNSVEGGLIYIHPNYHKRHRKISKGTDTNFRVYRA